jgi:class 3 adenylate cyclase
MAADPRAGEDEGTGGEPLASVPLSDPSVRTTLEELVLRSGAPAGHASLRDLLQRNFRSVVVVGLASVLALSIVVTGVAGTFIAGKTQETVVAQAKASLSDLTTREAENRNDPFERIAGFARMLQRDEEAILVRPEAHPAPRGPITLQIAENGATYKVERNGGASAFLPRFSPPTPERTRFVELTEAFDPLMESVLASMPDTIVAVYFNGADSFNRYVPFIDDVWKQFDPTLDWRTFNFYYVADEKHDPEGIPKWTEAYLDPAGQGWMVTCAVPIRRAGAVVGVTGIDVTIGKLVKSVIDLPLPADGAAMLTSTSGQILAMSPKLEPVLGLKELQVHDYGGEAVHQETIKPEEFQVARSTDPAARAFFERALAHEGAAPPEDVLVAGRDFVVTQGAIRETGWRLFVFTPKAEVLAPLAESRRRAQLTFGALVVIVLVAGALTTLAVLRRSAHLAKAIASPLKRLSEETAMLGTNLSPRTLEPVGIDEIDVLSMNFGRMAVELAERQQSAMDAAVARNVQQRSQELLLKTLPGPIVERMMAGERDIADAHEMVSVIFADVVGFTPFASTLPPREVVRVLEKVFVAFDGIMRRHGIEKIKTIGDAYMAVAGVPFPCEDHAARAARAALDMQRALERIDVGHELQMRIGLHAGPAVAGVIGKDKFLYDLWGDTVNIASRLESQGVPGRVQVSEDVVELLFKTFRFEPRGVVDLKGRGPTMTYWLLEEIHDPVPPTLALGSNGPG